MLTIFEKNGYLTCSCEWYHFQVFFYDVDDNIYYYYYSNSGLIVILFNTNGQSAALQKDFVGRYEQNSFLDSKRIWILCVTTIPQHQSHDVFLDIGSSTWNDVHCKQLVDSGGICHYCSFKHYLTNWSANFLLNILSCSCFCHCLEKEKRMILKLFCIFQHFLVFL